MAVIDNTTLKADIEKALDVEMVRNFDQEVNQLTDIIGIVPPTVMAAGTAMYQYKITGALSAEATAEGDEVPLSKYTVAKEPIEALDIKPYRKLTTAQAVLKGGYENAVLKTDNQMIKDIRAGIVSDFFKYLDNGTGTATGKTLQETLAVADATLEDKLEDNHDSADRLIHFVNRQDVAAYLGNAQISTQTLFGMTYIEDFLGIADVFLTNKVKKGSFYVTPVENLHIYGADFSALGQAGLSYATSDAGLIGVAHEAAYNRVSSITNVLTGTKLLAEVTDYIVKATIAPGA